MVQRLKNLRWLAAIALVSCSGCSSTSVVMSERTRPLTRAEIYDILTTTEVSAHFDGVSLEDALGRLEAAAGVDFVVFWTGLGYDEGLDAAKTIDLYLDRRIRLVDALELVLELGSVDARSRGSYGGHTGTWSLGHSWVEIGPIERLNERGRRVTIPVDEFVKRAPMFAGMSDDDRGIWLNAWAQARDESTDIERRYSEDEAVNEIIDLIQSTVYPFEWEENGGEGGNIRYMSGVMVVSAADYLIRAMGGYHFDETIPIEE